MCGRYSALTEEEIIEIREVIREVSLRLANDDWQLPTPGDVYPTHNAPVITGGTNATINLETLRWGFKKWDGKGVIINARSETLKTKSTFAPLLVAGRCVVPAGEYYEWQAQGKQKVKHYIKDVKGNLLFMAGLYRNAPGGQPHEREFVIITKQAHDNVAEIHDRMPVILRANQIEDWLCGKLSPEEISQLDFNATVTQCETSFSQMTL
ncbi:MAG: SOS response-associated peptidase [Defluviitaleaceae bacterium]|nr:SOS response-associated peptidase [Defluviitaleaceae bacterium]